MGMMTIYLHVVSLGAFKTISLMRAENSFNK